MGIDTEMTKVVLIILGIYIIFEAILGMLWTRNDKRWFAQLVRVSRIVIGVIMIVVGLYI